MAAVSEQWCISTRIFLILVILSTSANVHGWDSIDLELFDLVEEVKDNFYGVLGLKQVSTVVYFGGSDYKLVVYCSDKSSLFT